MNKTFGVLAVVMCRHREKYAAFQQHGKGKWRFMQPACRPVIARYEAIHTSTLDCFVPRNDGRDNLNCTLLNQLTDEERLAVKFVETDRWEVGGARGWNAGFAEKFRQLRGYDPATFLPVY
jgi:hypothetical protein